MQAGVPIVAPHLATKKRQQDAIWDHDRSSESALFAFFMVWLQFAALHQDKRGEREVAQDLIVFP